MKIPYILLVDDDRQVLGAIQRDMRNKYREEALVNLIKTNPHSPAMYRINGPLRNLNEWYQAYDVKEGSKLFIAPDQRVRIW